MISLQSMYAADATTLVGVIHFTPDMIVYPTGKMKHSRQNYRRYVCKRTGVERIELWFDGDTQSVYDHDYKVYLSKNFRTHCVLDKGVKIYQAIELFDTRGDNFFFRIHRNLVRSVPRGFVKRKFSFPGLQNRVMIF